MPLAEGIPSGVVGFAGHRRRYLDKTTHQKTPQPEGAGRIVVGSESPQHLGGWLLAVYF